MSDESYYSGWRWRLSIGILTLVILGTLYGLTQDAIVRATGELPQFELFTLAFVYGATAALAATFIANYIAQRVFGGPAIAYRLPEE